MWHRRAFYRTGPPAVAIALALALASCGGGGGGSTSTTRPQAAIIVKSHDPTAEEAAEKASEATREAAEGKECQTRLGNFLDRMNDLRQSLLAGLSYDEYVVRVQAVRAAYEAVPVDKLGTACVTGPAAKAEDAFNQYLRAANAWGECAATAGCAASKVEGRLQRRWKNASKSLDAAEGQS